MTLLATTGVRGLAVSGGDADERGRQVERRGRTVRMSAEVVEWAIKAAPRQIQIYDRRGNRNSKLGAKKIARDSGSE
ncbi:MAG: hypothetical protein U0X93_08525 [Anaerolineales bacterium]